MSLCTISLLIDNFLLNFFQPRKCQVSDAQKIQSFIDSYELGTRILKGKFYCFHFKQCCMYNIGSVLLFFRSPGINMFYV